MRRDVAMSLNFPNGTTHLHVMPVGDLRHHRPSTACWCSPKEAPDEPGLWVHEAMDGRDLIEKHGLQ